MFAWECLINSWEKREAEAKGEKERYIHLNAEFQRIERRDKKGFLSEQCKKKKKKKKRKTIEWERLEISVPIVASKEPFLSWLKRCKFINN